MPTYIPPDLMPSGSDSFLSLISNATQSKFEDAETEIHNLIDALEEFLANNRLFLALPGAPCHRLDTVAFYRMLHALVPAIERLTSTLDNPNLWLLTPAPGGDEFDPCVLVRVLRATVRNDTCLKDQYVREHAETLLVYVKAIGDWVTAEQLRLAF